MGDNPERLNSEASFTALCGVRPIEHSSGRRSTRRLQPRRRPAGERGPARHRVHPPTPRPACPGVLRTPHPGGRGPP
ncbi:transposase [Streptomyces atrovirens]|uniref:Transposase n=1 Tax=Streptomyces atrovirens TaxID=285556 RepID=A0ABW0DNM4_9ACTN